MLWQKNSQTNIAIDFAQTNKKYPTDTKMMYEIFTRMASDVSSI